MREALSLLLGGDAELYGIIARTLLISGMATLLAMLVGIPIGYVLARGRFPRPHPAARHGEHGDGDAARRGGTGGLAAGRHSLVVCQ